MSANEYMKAQKLGEKCYQTAVAKGENPYLPVLEEIITNSDIDCEVNLGLQNITLSQVVGTATTARTTAFASNFMPILDLKTEFGTKWVSLCTSHVEEGIHDPIKAYEYMNKYYVIEGNKRVSVLKYFGADSIPAMVTRKMPKRTDDLENKIYYEFVDFHKQTGINYVWFSQLGGFDKLREYIGITKDDVFTDEDRMNFNSAHVAFSQGFTAKAKDEKNLTITVDDAMLVFLNLYSYDKLKEMGFDEVKAAVAKVWDEITLSNKKKEETISPKLDPAMPKKKLFNILSTAPKLLKVAFIYDKSPDTSAWIYGHELGRVGLEEKFKEQVETEAFSGITDNGKLTEKLNELVDKKYDVIFTTGPDMLTESLKVAIEHPEIKILNCSLNMSNSRVRTYYARMYEAKFITGIIAGSLSPDGKIGYIADYPIYGMTANINAFALGARLVNPRAKIYLEWSKVKNSNPKESFKQKNIIYVSDYDMITPESASREFGLYANTQDEIVNLAMPFYDWKIFYTRIIQAILDGNWKQEEKEEKTKVLNYWWGMSAGVVDIIFSKNIPEGTRRLVELMKKLIMNNEVAPFYGCFHAQDGTMYGEEGKEMGAEQIMKMNWLCENVVGAMPELHELVDDAKDVVALQGVNTPDKLELKTSTETKTAEE